MKTTSSSTTSTLPSASASFLLFFLMFERALNKWRVYLTVYCLIITVFWNTHSVLAAPAKLDSSESIFLLDLHPPIFEASALSAASQPKGNNDAATTIDSYGNPIESLQPIETPDGRKVVNTQGLQFEIPNYASGITELKKPADDLLPPFVDPIIVALPNESPNSFTANADSSSPTETTAVDVEIVPLVKFRSDSTASQGFRTRQSAYVKNLPKYILELNDPDIDGPVDYMPSEDNRSLKVIAWDLLPPLEAEEANKSIKESDKVNAITSHNLNAQASRESSHITYSTQTDSRDSVHTTTKPNVHNRGSAFYSSTPTIRLTTTTAATTRRITSPRTTTTTTLRTTTTPRTTTTTTIKSTTPRTTTKTTTTTTTAEPDSSEFFRLEAGDSYTLPTWLQDIDDPDLDVAVAYAVPEDINEYNHTIERNILPPLEPYTDLHNLHLTPPPNYKHHTTTQRTTTTRGTTVSTTPRTTMTPITTQPILPTSQPHLLRTKPTIATFNSQFTSSSQTIPSFNFAQHTSTTRTTTTTTIKPKTTTNYYNQPLSTTPQTDKFGSASSSTIRKETSTGSKGKNPFLPSSFDDGKYRPQNFNGRNTATTTRRTTTTTTTTPIPVEENPFVPTIPPYLRDFDYTDLGPGVPFIYNPNEDENPVDENILPPSKIIEDKNEPAFTSNTSPNSPFLNSQTSQGFTNKFTSSTISLASSSSIPSIVTIPLPSTQTNQDVNTATQPPIVFVPPPPTTAEGIIIADKADKIIKKTSTTFNKHFAVPFEPTTSATTSLSAAIAGDQKKVPLSTDRESFPPFSNVNTGSSPLSSKTTFTKSEDGKVITNNVFLSGGAGAAGTAFGLSSGGNSQDKNAFTGPQSFTGSGFTKSTTTSSDFKQFGTTSAATSDFITFDGASKYTGRFGGPDGVLAPQNGAFTSTTTTLTKTYNKPSFTTLGTIALPGLAATNNQKFTGSFGGPPGILKPYDNVKTV